VQSTFSSALYCLVFLVASQKTERSKISQSTIHHGTLHLQLLGWWYDLYLDVYHSIFHSKAHFYPMFCFHGLLVVMWIWIHKQSILKNLWNWKPQIPKGEKTQQPFSTYKTQNVINVKVDWKKLTVPLNTNYI